MLNSRISPLMLSTVMLSVTSAQIPDGYEIVHITDNPNDYSSVPKINSCGEIVFSTRINQSKSLEEIFLYDNGLLTRLTDDDARDAYPDINEDGTAVWTEGADGFGGGTIVMYREGVVTEIGTGQSPAINNLGHVAWNVYGPTGCAHQSDIFFYDGNTVQQITDDGLSNQSVAINDHDQLAWTRYHFCPNPWVSHIMLYSEQIITPLPAQQTEPQIPDINNRAQVIWGGPGGLELWEDGVTTLVTDWGRNPAINNHSDLYFIRWHDDTSAWQGWLCLDCDPSGEGDPTFLQLTDDPFWNIDGDINDYLEVVWQAANFPESDIRFLRRIRDGDADFDGDIDLDDFAMFDDCFTGPVSTDRLCECRFLDLDHDRDVDWVDFGIFQTNYTGAE